MSAAATAAGYLYASGRLRGRNKEDEEHEPRERAPKRRTLRFAHLPEQEPAPQPRAEPRVKTVRVEYRTRRWKPGDGV
jgi:hypothetical protein